MILYDSRNPAAASQRDQKIMRSLFFSFNDLE